MRVHHTASFLAAAALACASHRPPGEHEPGGGSIVGHVWSVHDRRWVDEPALEAALPRADLVLLGETHDNPAHHRLQARLLAAIVAAGRRPAVAFEMLDPEQQPAVDAAVARAPRDPDALATAVGWERSGWPAFSLYRPIFQVALDAGLPIVAANLTRRLAREVAVHGEGALAPDVRRMLDRQGPLPEDVARAYRQEMQDSHCGALPEDMLDAMVTMQRARDAQIAERLLAAGAARGAVLIAGSGHARTDRGVPVFLAREAPSRKTLSVAFLEASPRKQTPDDYAQDFGTASLPFDYVVFTQAAPREDPCRGIREHIHPLPKAPLPGSTSARR